MNTQKAIVVLTTMGLATIGSLLYLAMVGNVWAVGVLFGGWTLIVLIVGYGLATLQQHLADKREQRNFQANAKENAAIMQGNFMMLAAAQKAQNLQNQAMQQQLATANRLPQPAPILDEVFPVEEGIYRELGD
jgi:hypothetical protein